MNAKLLISLTCVSLGLTACSDDYFDQEAYDAKLKQAFPVDDVDPTHTWATMGTAQINATVNGDYGETYRVAVYKENPLTTSPVTLLTAASVTSGSQASLTLSFPLASPFVYVACYDKYNRYLVKAVEVSDGATVDVNFFGEDTSAARQQNTTRAVTNPNLTDTDYSAYVKAKETKKDYMAFVNPTWVSYENIPSLSSITKIMNQERLSNDNDVFNRADADGHKWWCLYEGEIDQAFNLEGDQNKVNKAVVYVLGTLNLKKSYNGVTFIVGQGGKLNINTDIYLGPASRIVVLSGGTLTIAQGKKLQLGNNGVSVGLYNAGTVNVQGTLNGGGTTGALLYNAGTMTIKTLENMRYLFNYGTMTITDNFTIPNNADCPISTTNKYHFYNEGELTISTGTTGNAVNYGKITGTGLSISDTYLFNGGEITFSSTFSAKTLYNFGKLTAKKNTTKDAYGNIYNDRFIYNACYLHYTEGITQDIAVKNLFMMKNSRFVVDGDFYLQDAANKMENRSMLEVGGDFGMPRNLNFTLTGPNKDKEFAIVKIAGKLVVTKWSEMKPSGIIYFDWAKRSDPYNNVEIQQNENENDIDYLLKKQMKNFITEKTAPANITIPAGDCTGTGYNTTPPTDITQTEEVVQGYRFCFEDNFPVPGDYDFNDCVITVTPVVKGKDVTLTVSLDGVGATKTIGAALRLVGINESDITSASCNADLNSGQQSGSVYARVTPVRELGTNVFAVTDKGFAANGSKITDLVVRLFDNAHYAMSGGNSYDSKFYNTVSPSDPLAGKSYVAYTKSSRTMTFTFVVSDKDKAQQFLKQPIYDVFIVENHNGKTYEVHTVNYKFDEVLGTYYGDGSKLTAYKNTVTVNYPWAVCVPHSSKAPFYYPREWWSISGTKIQEGQDTENYGGTPAVYPDFKSWAADKTQSQEWYKHPVMDRVFKLN